MDNTLPQRATPNTERELPTRAMLRRDGKPLLAAETILALPLATRTSLQATEELTAALVMAKRFDLVAVAWADHAQAHPESTGAIVSTAKAYLDAENPEEARLWIDILRSRDPQHPEIDILTTALSASGAPRQAE